jgi:hypothetical protein
VQDDLLTIAIVHDEPWIAFIRLSAVEFQLRALFAHIANTLDLDTLLQQQATISGLCGITPSVILRPSV